MKTKIIQAYRITEAVADLCRKANTVLSRDIVQALIVAKKRERDAQSKYAFEVLIKNALIASTKHIPLCQDTGMAVVYVDIGQGVQIEGDLEAAIHCGVKQGYKTGYLRKSVVKDPLLRENTHTNAPAIIYYTITKGSHLKIMVCPKGFGSENKSAIKMFLPTENISAVEDFIVETVKKTGADACPPYIVGVGIGGTLDKAVLLSKQASLIPLFAKNPHRHWCSMETRLLKKINHLHIGVMGLGGNTTALGVKIKTYPTHIAGLPVAVNISCHATRKAEAVL